MENIDNKKIVMLWHGGRGLEYSYKSPKASSKGRWEHGPGLYLTTHYETAKKYARGGGTTYKVALELGNHIKDINIHIDEVLTFVTNHIVKRKQKDIIDDLHNNIKRMNSHPFVEAETLVNLCVNYEALKGDKTIELNKFLVENGVDYGTVNNFGGRSETVCVVYNLSKIKKVKIIRSADISLEQFELSFPKKIKTTKVI